MGRLSGDRHFGTHDWYREGASWLIDGQTLHDGSWNATFTAIETDKVVASSFALLFLSKGLAPVLINKLNYGAAHPNWNLHPNDVRNLAEFTSSLPRWPKLLTYQEVDLEKVMAQGSVRDLLQAPILYLSGAEEPKFTDAQVQLLRSYVEQGGFIFAVNNWGGAGFEEGVRSLAARIYPAGEAQLKRLPPEHPIYRAEYPLDPEGTELWGVDFGCRTSFVYSPLDHSCLWDKWSFQPVPKRTPQFNAILLRSMRVGVNVVAYATGREPYDKLDAPQEEAAGGAQELYNIRPDLTTMGKIIGGGLPVGAYGGSSEIMNLVSPVGPMYQAGTLSGNPLAMAAGCAMLKHLRDQKKEIYPRIEKLSGQLVEGVAAAAKDAGVALCYNRVGSMFTWFFTPGPVTDWDSASKSNTQAFGKFFRSMLDSGVYLPPSQYEAAFLGAAHTEEDVQRTIAVAKQAFAAVRG